MATSAELHCAFSILTAGGLVVEVEIDGRFTMAPKVRTTQVDCVPRPIEPWRRCCAGSPVRHADKCLAPLGRRDEVWRWFAEDVVIEPPQVVQRGGQQALRCAGVVPGAHVDDHLRLDTGIAQHLPERIAG